MSRSGDDPMPDKLTSRPDTGSSDGEAAPAGRRFESAHPAPDGATATLAEPIFDVGDVSVFYGEHRAVRDISMRIQRNEITALNGPSGCG